MVEWTPRQQTGFANAAHSLRLYRRADLTQGKPDQDIIERLYVDPLPHNGVLTTMLRPNTTFLIGRKGTGKSTVFQRAQHEIRKNSKFISAYIDVKTVFESSEGDPALVQQIAAQTGAPGSASLQRLLLFRAFVEAVFDGIREELKKQLSTSWTARFKELFGGARKDMLAQLDKVLRGISDADFIDVTAYQLRGEKGKLGREGTASRKSAAEVSSEGIHALTGPSLKIGAKASFETGDSIREHEDSESTYSRILIRSFDLTKTLKELGALLAIIGINRLYIFIDDFSELPPDAMEIFVDTVLAPLNNWSNELIKFKIAAYPSRIYFGRIDKTKIDEIYLDIFKLYGLSDVSTMEDKAIDFTKRLLITRIKEYCKVDPSVFMDSRQDAVYRALFNCTMGNPRNLGHILHYLHESNIVYGKPITVRSISEASIKYFDEKVEPFFGIAQFRLQSFEERSSIFSLKELFEQIVNRARDLRTYSKSALAQKLSGRLPTSHFHIVSGMDSILSTLELNFFVTKYFEMKDRDGRKVSIYAINFGLCAKESISFGRPEGDREFRLYYVERIFDYSPVLQEYLRANQEIKCERCDASHGLDMLDSIKVFGMLCPACKQGTCHVTNLSRKYEHVLKSINQELLLPQTELGILETLYTENRKMVASDIAAELDCSYQLVGKRGKIMADRGLVERSGNDQNRRLYDLTADARRKYFSENRARHLQIND
jgi:DNA-binding MarR family transcriptional regulator